MKKIMLAITVIGLMVSCSNERSGNREITRIVKVKLDNGDLDWVRLNSIEMKVFKEGDTIKVLRSTHRITADSSSQKAIITSIIK